MMALLLLLLDARVCMRIRYAVHLSLRLCIHAAELLAVVYVCALHQLAKRSSDNDPQWRATVGILHSLDHVRKVR